VDEPPVDVEIEKPHVHHKRTGHNWFDLAIPLAALFVSFVSIFIAWHHGLVMKELVHQNEKLVEANSLPYLQIYGSNGPNGFASFSVTNEGVGPARIATAELLVDGRPVQTLPELMRACCGPGDYSTIGTSTLIGRMERPGDVVEFVKFTPGQSTPTMAAAFDSARKDKRIEARLCYCSVFDDCWKVSSFDPTPVALDQCPPVRRAYRE
jgi:hypothetical protein